MSVTIEHLCYIIARMSTRVNAKFRIKSWDEKTFEDIGNGAKLTRASVSYSYNGDIEGDSKLDFLMAYREDGTGNFVGLEHIAGQVGERTGSFIVQHSGTFNADGVKVTLSIMPGSGTSDLQNLRGEGSAFLPSQQEEYSITLDCDFA